MAMQGGIEEWVKISDERGSQKKKNKYINKK